VSPRTADEGDSYPEVSIFARTPTLRLEPRDEASVSLRHPMVRGDFFFFCGDICNSILVM
jgi:hypothetical protein